MIGQKRNTLFNNKSQHSSQTRLVTCLFILGITKTEQLHKVLTLETHTRVPSPPRLVRAAVFLKTPQAEWLRWLHQEHVDIFVAINHQAQSGCIHGQPCHLSTLLLLSPRPSRSRPPSLSPIQPSTFSLFSFLPLLLLICPTSP